LTSSSINWRTTLGKTKVVVMGLDNVSPAYGDALYLMLGVLLLFMVFYLIALWRGGWGGGRGGTRQTGARPATGLRSIPAYEATRKGLAVAAETGRAIHTSPGTGVVGAGDAGTAATLAGLLVTESMARVGAITGAPIEATTNDAIAYALTDNAVRRGYKRAGWPIEGESGEARFLTHNDPIAYVAAASEVATQKDVSQAVMSGKFGPEVLLLMEAQRRTGAAQIGGSSDPQGFAIMHITADHTLIGEEIFASGAYLERRPSHIASLLAQDGLRWVLIVLVLAGFIVANILGIDWTGWFSYYP
jgi:hypothetical protein